MPVKKFITKRPRISFSIIAIACIGGSLAVTQVQANIHPQSEVSQHNSHQIPSDLNANTSFMDKVLDPIRSEAKELLDEVKDGPVLKEDETIHAAAFDNKQVSASPTYDYTTGTSN